MKYYILILLALSISCSDGPVIKHTFCSSPTDRVCSKIEPEKPKEWTGCHIHWGDPDNCEPITVILMSCEYTPQECIGKTATLYYCSQDDFCTLFEVDCKEMDKEIVLPKKCFL